MHYSGNKNSSVFRRLLGGALLRKEDPHHPCLWPAPGQGHWEKQGVQTCPRCRPVEEVVSTLLEEEFWFRCIEVKDMGLRNKIEKLLIATVSLCPVCGASERWLGHWSYSDNMKRSGLWNSDHVFDWSLLMVEDCLELLARLVRNTPGNSSERSVT